MGLIRQWFERYFSDPQAVVLAVILLLGFGIVLTMGTMLAPVLASIVIAYLLEGIVLPLERRGAPRNRVFILVFLVFMAFLLFLLFAVVPLLWGQAAELARELPNYVHKGQETLLRLPEHY
ncbi:MAG TPA: AI-2E family transporter, partial [Gammaproteobacteria bacterium]